MISEKRSQIITEFKLANTRQFAFSQLHGREQNAFIEIGKKYNEQRTEAERIFRKEHDTRLADAKQKVRQKLASNTPELTPRGVPSDRFNKDNIERRAVRIVYFDHKKTMHRINKAEAEEKDNFLSCSSARKKYRESFKDASEQRRSGERRKSPDRRGRRIQTMTD